MLLYVYISVLPMVLLSFFRSPQRVENHTLSISIRCGTPSYNNMPPLYTIYWVELFLINLYKMLPPIQSLPDLKSQCGDTQMQSHSDGYPGMATNSQLDIRDTESHTRRHCKITGKVSVRTRVKGTIKFFAQSLKNNHVLFGKLFL